MGFKCGIVGLPNVGKSTLFNALVGTAMAAAENYPFCTIEPNLGQVPVPDPRLETIAKIAQSRRIVPTQLSFVDIAGLVRGASRGEGLGNKFLGHIREVDALLMVVRCFEDPNVSHVDTVLDPLRDLETIDTELMLADLESLERRYNAIQKKAKGGDKEAREQKDLMTAALDCLREGKPARAAAISATDTEAFSRLNLLTGKPIFYVCNVEESALPAGNQLSDAVCKVAANNNAPCIILCAALEQELAEIGAGEDQTALLKEMGLEKSGLAQVVQAGYKLLDLITFFTAGEKECRAWTVPEGTRAAQAAGTIHTDFERGFIRAETISYADYIANQGETGSREAGKLRLEGRDYIVVDGDIMHFRFNV